MDITELISKTNDIFNTDFSIEDRYIKGILNGDITYITKILKKGHNEFYGFEPHSWKILSRYLDVYNFICKNIEKLNYVNLEFEMSRFKHEIFIIHIVIPYICIKDVDIKLKFDTNDNLLGFINGVYDIKTCIFRDGIPEDMILSPFIVHYSDENTDEIKEIIEKDFPDKEIRERYLTLFYMLLFGLKNDQVYIFPHKNNTSGIIEKYIGLYQYIFGYVVDHINGFNDHLHDRYMKVDDRYKRFLCTRGHYEGKYISAIHHPYNHIRWFDNKHIIIEFDYVKRVGFFSLEESKKLAGSFMNFLLKFMRT